MAQIAAAVREAPVEYFEEKGPRVGGRLRWLHSASREASRSMPLKQKVSGAFRAPDGAALPFLPDSVQAKGKEARLDELDSLRYT